jgi:hypothetical protein
MIALPPEAYRAVMESSQAAADRDALAEAGLDVGPPLPPSLRRMADDYNVFYYHEPEPQKPAQRLNYSTLFLLAVALLWLAGVIAEAMGGRP